MPVVKFYSWKLELQVMQGDQEVSDSDMFVMVQCGNCNTMASLGKLSIEHCTLRMPVYSSETWVCSNCMDSETFKYLTGQ